MNWAGALETPVTPINIDTPKVYDLPAFDGYGDPRRLDVIAKIAEAEGRDPRLATLAVQIFREAGVQPRDYKGQAAALLRWVQRNVYYVNEPDERLQSPTYTLRTRYGDCDDMLILLYALCIAVRLPFRLVISGIKKKTGEAIRYHHKDKSFDRAAKYTHIYGMIGNSPYGDPTEWWYAEPTLNVPLGWDVVAAGGNILPEMILPSPTKASSSYGVAMPTMPAMHVASPVVSSESINRRRFTPANDAMTGAYTSSPSSSVHVSASKFRGASSGTSGLTSPYTTPRLSPQAFRGTSSGTSGLTSPYTTPNIGTRSFPGLSSGSSLTPGFTSRPAGPASNPNFPGLNPFRLSGEGSDSSVVNPQTGLVEPTNGLSSDVPSSQMGADGADAANSVAVLLLDSAGQILLLHRAPDQAWMGGSWDLPGAAVDPSKSAREQAAAIVSAETGLTIPAGALTPLVSAFHPTGGTSVFFAANIGTSATVTPNTPEHTAFQWVDPDMAAARKDLQMVPYMPLVLEALFRRRQGNGSNFAGVPTSGTTGAVWKVLGVLGAGIAVGVALGVIDVSPKLKRNPHPRKRNR